MKTNTIDIVDGLALIATKVASNVFDLSSSLHHISIRDQMVRAQLVVRDLHRGDPNLEALLIVGAGVAGICAALAAIKCGVKKVVVVEVESEPFHLLFRGADYRHVGPFMYEWPSTFYNDQSYPHHNATPWSEEVAAAPLKWKAKNPVSAAELAELLTKDLKVQLGELKIEKPGQLTICVEVNRLAVQNFVREFASTEAARALGRLQRRVPIAKKSFSWNYCVWPDKVKVNGEFKPDYVLLAAGMGYENTRLLSKDQSGLTESERNYVGPRFWGPDDLLSAGTANLDVAIFGGGDGALQDTLRALTGRKHPLQFMAFLEGHFAVRSALARVMPRLLDADRQSRQFGTWTGKQYRSIDDTCRSFALELSRNNRVVRRVEQGLRRGSGTVSLFVRDDHFDKAYLLNRFIVHLIEACSVTQKSMWSGRMRWSGRMQLHVLRNRCAVGYRPAPEGGRYFVEIATPDKSGSKTSDHYEYHCDKIAVRYGITPRSIPGSQMIQVSDRSSRQRTSLSRIELPFVAESN